MDVKPDEFIEVAAGEDRLLLRRELADELAPQLRSFLDGAALPGASLLAGGRGETIAVPLRDGGRAVLRRNLRGGLPARFVRDLYVGRRPRPFEEVRATERLRRAGVDVPEALGAIVRRVGPGGYRGAGVTREIAGSLNLGEYLHQAGAVERRRSACVAALELLNRLLAAGGVHPDLNLQNFLVTEEGRHLWLIDCDGVRFARTGESHLRRALQRLRRSARRLDPRGEVIDPAWFDASAVAAMGADVVRP